jgi:hypothetical protein
LRGKVQLKILRLSNLFGKKVLYLVKLN